ncbi:hypothetical protein DVA67_024890 [Solirubrobacter sp. CPCC 204708]|uniref:Uncharacterized protein n=1 Tax=Solirubrobacter deserti TaxID=2282478 RepID=A0ABT4RNV1_9ACTN|nr:hypothetical protein [Solirubrobacter deserti]MBE2319237.1 hypothetical protein [Solirubrobacter deserti]MDA0140243.1 hypothetical protein [Solirubrobacter deserti]
MLALLVALLLVPAPHASGGGIPSAAWGGAGASAPGGKLTYIVLPSGRGSLVQAVHRDGGSVDLWKQLPRRYGVPMAAYDGTMTGLSADGRVLVLAEVPGVFPVRRTRLLVLRTRGFRELERFSLSGHYAVVAISPHGRYVYLRRLTAPTRNPLRTELVVLDRGEPGAPRPIGGESADIPSSSVSDGRWTYTLFQRDGSWVQGLDTVTQATRRWEVPGVPGNDLMRLRLENGSLHVGAKASFTVR